MSSSVLTISPFEIHNRMPRLPVHHFQMVGLLLSLLLVTGCSDHLPDPSLTDKETLRQDAIRFYQALYSTSATVDSYVATSYAEHQISAGFTLAGLKAYAQNRAQTIANHRIIIHRTLVEGNLVGLHLEEKVAADSFVARMALLRFDGNGKIIEHWEAAQGQPQQRANPNTMFDGAPVNYQSTAGIRYRDASVAIDTRTFNQYDTLLVRQTRALTYIQHNPVAANGADAVIGLLVFLKTQGFKTTSTNYQKLAEGDFVMSLGNYQTTPAFPGFTNSVAFDLTRLQEDGKYVEHWDVLQEIKGADKSKAF